MKSLHIRNIEPNLLMALKRLAQSHHRSLQGELHAILEHAARLAPPESENVSLDLITVSTNSSSNWNREEIYDDQGR